MTYLERTLEVRSALLKRVDLLERIRAIFRSVSAKDGVVTPFASGSTNSVFEVGQCELRSGNNVVVILKLKNRFLKHRRVLLQSKFSFAVDLGAYETYYDFAAGYIDKVSFRSKAAHVQHVERRVGSGLLPLHLCFSLDEHWGGTRLARGDIGALPYFQLVVRFKQFVGLLTEGLPPVVAPMLSVAHEDDDSTSEEGRIIDLSHTQSLLIAGDVGETGVLGRYHGNFGLRRRGEKYFRREHRLDL